MQKKRQARKEKNNPRNQLGTVRVWHSSTYRLENTLNYGMERVWGIATTRGSNNIAVAYDEGTIVIKVTLPLI